MSLCLLFRLLVPYSPRVVRIRVPVVKQTGPVAPGGPKISVPPAPSSAPKNEVEDGADSTKVSVRFASVTLSCPVVAS